MEAIVVTGVSKGLGRAILDFFSQQGIFVYGLTRDASEFLQGENREIISCDIRKIDNIQKARKHIASGPHNLTGVINNAGIGYWKDVVDESYEEIYDTIQTNFFGAVHCTKEFLPILLQSGHGTVITVSSILALNGKSGRSSYAASKAALNLYMESLREEVCEKGVSISVLCPGPIATPMRDPSEIEERKTEMLHPENVAKVIFQTYENNLHGTQTRLSVLQK